MTELERTKQKLSDLIGAVDGVLGKHNQAIFFTKITYPDMDIKASKGATVPVGASDALPVNALGVTSLKRVITYVGAQIKGAFLIDSDGDGKNSTAEYLAYAFSLIPTIPGIIPALQNSQAEFRDLTNEEITELVDHVLRTDFLPDDRDRAEHYVKALFYTLNVSRLFIKFSVDFFAGKDVVFNPTEGLI